MLNQACLCLCFSLSFCLCFSLSFCLCFSFCFIKSVLKFLNLSLCISYILTCINSRINSYLQTIIKDLCLLDKLLASCLCLDKFLLNASTLNSR